MVRQIWVPEGTTETAQVRALLEEMNIAGALVTADAFCTPNVITRFS
ncbi:hypothetical protein [Actinoallomurus oryzae]